MAAQDDSETTPSLAPPSLAPPKLFGRRPKAPRAGDAPVAPGAAETSEPAAAPETSEATGSGDTQVLAETESAFVDAGTDAPDGPEVAAAAPASGAGRRPRLPRLPDGVTMPSNLGAPVAGLLTGIALLAFTWVGLRGCEALRGTTSCGTGPGLLALVVVLILAVLVGRVLLVLLKVPEPGMTSFLAIGLTSLVAVLGPSAILDSAAVVVLVPLVCAVTFVVAAWIATLEVDLDD